MTLPTPPPSPYLSSRREDRADLQQVRLLACTAGGPRYDRTQDRVIAPPAGRSFRTVVAIGAFAAAAVSLSIVAGGTASTDTYAELRESMVDEQIVQRGIRQPEVVEAMRRVPRHAFVPPELRSQAYRDHPLPIGHDQTISQPYVVALMTELLELDAGSRVLEIGTGSGYHAAVLSRVAGEVFTIEIVEPLGRAAQQTLSALGYDNVHVRIGDGYRGWPEEAPFDAVLLTAAPEEIPDPLVEQLRVGGRMVLPVGGDWAQDLMVITRTAEGREVQKAGAVRFVPMTGEAREREDQR